jgi:hypothetical protein
MTVPLFPLGPFVCLFTAALGVQARAARYRQVRSLERMRAAQRRHGLHGHCTDTARARARHGQGTDTVPSCAPNREFSRSPRLAGLVASGILTRLGAPCRVRTCPCKSVQTVFRGTTRESRGPLARRRGRGMRLRSQTTYFDAAASAVSAVTIARTRAAVAAAGFSSGLP